MSALNLTLQQKMSFDYIEAQKWIPKHMVVSPTGQMTIIKPDRWFFCSLCQYVNYKFECCENVSCSGSGCDECGPNTAIRREVNRLIDNKETPSKEDVPFHENRYWILREQDHDRKNR